MRSQSVCVLAAALAAASCSDGKPATVSPAAPAPELRYDGATTISNKILPDLLPAFEERSGIKVRVDRSGTGAGLRRVLAGEVDVAGVSRALADDELALKPYFQIIGYDALGVFVGDATPVKALTGAQLKAIFTGAATSWKALGGKDVPIRPCTEKLGSKRATLDALQSLAMDGAPYRGVMELEDPADCLAYVAATPGAIAAATMTYRVSGVRPLEIDGSAPTPPNVRSSRYLLTRPLLLVSREAPHGPLAQLFEYALSPDGQAVVAKAGFVPAR
ncbi:MAG TPA: substrate-binding domain-containing protein [Anaeromyxobacter sp.]